MRVLAISGLFPRSTAPTFGLFVLQRLAALAERGAIVRVISPLPSVPPGPLPSRYVRMRATPARETVGGLDVWFPRYFMLPRIGMRWQAAGYARGIRRLVRRMVDEYRPDVLDVHYLYPDACGVARVAKELGVPYVCSARGSDVHVLAGFRSVRSQIRESLAGAAAVVAVSRGLAKRMRDLQLYDGRIEIIPNGVDTERFRPGSRTEARARLGLPAEGRHIVCVAGLVPVHGHELLLRALAHTDAPPELVLHLVGQGPLQSSLARLARDLDVPKRVVFEGTVPHEQIPDWFAAVDGAVQLSRSAGSPNAVLESIACGTPVLASDIPEMREALDSPGTGLLVPREVPAVARGLRRLLEIGPASARPRSWIDVADEVMAVLHAAAASSS